jgi:hypothetical protein
MTKKEKRNCATVPAFIEMGVRYLRKKEVLKHGEFLDYIQEKSNFSLRQVENSMKLAKTPIHPNHYKLGVTRLLNLAYEGANLSTGVLDSIWTGELTPEDLISIPNLNDIGIFITAGPKTQLPISNS